MAFTAVATGLQARIRTGLRMAIESLTKTYAGEAVEQSAYESAQWRCREIVDATLATAALGSENLVALLTSAARTATTASADQTNVDGARGAVVVLDVTAGATLDLTISIQRKNAAGTYTNICTAATNITAAGRIVLILDPKIGTTLAGVSTCTDGALPHEWRVNIVHGNANSATYSVAAYRIR